MKEEKNFLLAKERTHLAFERTRLSAERTLSSWVRTALTSVGGGFAIIRLLVFQDISHKILANIVGEILILCGSFVLIFALISYRRFYKSIKQDLRKSNEVWITLTVILFILVSFFLLFVSAT